MKKYSIEELNVYHYNDTTKDYVCHITSKEQHDKLKKHSNRS